MRIQGTVALVTGASSGIGAATVEALARRGATVIGLARRADRLDAVVKAIEPLAPGSRGYVCDVADRDACEAAAARALAELGRVDIVVNNAGVALRRAAEDTSSDDIERVMRINFFGAVWITNALLPQLLERRRGAIVNVTSVAGTVPNPQESAYAASKAGLSMWTHTLSVDLQRHGIYCGTVSPGPIATEIWATDNPSGYRGARFPATMVANAIVRSIEKERVHVTTPKRFGLVGATYPLFGRMYRFGLRRFDDKMRARLADGERAR